MNRRSFLAALAALPFAGKAIEALAALSPAPTTWLFSTVPGENLSITTLQQAYRKMQGSLLKSFNARTEEWDLFE